MSREVASDLTAMVRRQIGVLSRLIRYRTSPIATQFLLRQRVRADHHFVRTIKVTVHEREELTSVVAPHLAHLHPRSTWLRVSC